jgi:hypothetical protein
MVVAVLQIARWHFFQSVVLLTLVHVSWERQMHWEWKRTNIVLAVLGVAFVSTFAYAQGGENNSTPAQVAGSALTQASNALTQAGNALVKAGSVLAQTGGASAGEWFTFFLSCVLGLVVICAVARVLPSLRSGPNRPVSDHALLFAAAISIASIAGILSLMAKLGGSDATGLLGAALGFLLGRSTSQSNQNSTDEKP